MTNMFFYLYSQKRINENEWVIRGHLATVSYLLMHYEAHKLNGDWQIILELIKPNI